MIITQGQLDEMFAGIEASLNDTLAWAWASE